MASNYKQPGDVLPFVAPTGGVTAGVPLFIGGLFVVPMNDAEATEEFQGQITGCFLLAKTTSQTYAVGDPLYWDEDPGKLTSNSASGPFIGAASKAAASADTTGEVRLNGVAQEASLLTS